MRRVSEGFCRLGMGLRRAGLVGGVIFGVSLAAPAGAVDIKTVGSWTAFRAETSDGITICGISTTLVEGRMLYLKWYKGDDYLTVQAFKESWQIPPHVTPKVSLTFPGSNPWTANGSSSDKVSSIVEFTVPKAVVKPFIKDFTTSSMGTYEFPGGSEPPWQLNMSGSAGALDVMAQCVEGVAGPEFGNTPLAYLRRPAPAFGGGPGPGPGPGPTGRPTQPF